MKLITTPKVDAYTIAADYISEADAARLAGMDAVRFRAWLKGNGIHRYPLIRALEA